MLLRSHRISAVTHAQTTNFSHYYNTGVNFLSYPFYRFLAFFIECYVHKQQAQRHSKYWLHSVNAIFPAVSGAVSWHGGHILVPGLSVFSRHCFDKVIDNSPNDVINNNQGIPACKFKWWKKSGKCKCILTSKGHERNFQVETPKIW